MPHDLKCITLKWKDKEITETLKSGLNDDLVSEWRCTGIFGLVNNSNFGFWISNFGIFGLDKQQQITLGNEKAKCKYTELSIFKNGNKTLEE